MKKEKKKPLEILKIIAIIIVGLIAIYAVVCLLGGPMFYPDFYRRSVVLRAIPDLSGGFIPQGVTASDGSDEVYICGYLGGDQNSRIYRLTSDGSSVRILLRKEDGSAYTGHAGGLTMAGKYIYVSNASKIFVLDAAAIRNAADGDAVAFIGHFDVPCRSSFCSSDGEMLYVGEYHAVGYETEDSHRVETRDGLYQAMVFAYRLSSDAELGVKDTARPEKAYAVCDKAQGFAVLPDGTAVVSCSFGLAASSLRRYRVDGQADAGFAYQGETIPLYVLDSLRATESFSMPHMSEDVEYRNGKLMIAFEGAAKKYGAGLLPFSIGSVMEMKMN
ncbi:MAG: hypothetical protein KIG36_02745 [Eubacteriales bacterium]|nr:hypothetical protein [Eubacteriales bacterium]